MSNVFSNAHALFIGVGKDLPISVKDAEALSNVFVDPIKAAYDPTNVQLLTETNATKEKIIEGFDRLIKQTNDDSTVIIYYSGHGTHTQGGGSFLLVPNNYSATNDNTWLKDEEFNEKISKIKARKLVVLLDACHSAGMAKSITPPGGVEELPMQSISSQVRSFVSKLEGGTGRAFISSCTDNQKSWILPNAQNSLFTLAIIESLHGKHPHAEDDKFVNLLQMVDYVSKQVSKRIQSIQQVQNPYVNRIENMSDGFPLCFLPEGIRKDMPIPGHDKSKDLLQLELDGMKSNVSMLIRKVTFMQNQQSILADPAQQFQLQEQLLELANRKATFTRRIEQLEILIG